MSNLGPYRTVVLFGLFSTVSNLPGNGPILAHATGFDSQFVLQTHGAAWIGPAPVAPPCINSVMGFSWCSRSSARKPCAGLLKFLPPQTKTFMATVTQMSRSFGCSRARWSSARHRTAGLRAGRRHGQSGRFGGARGLVPQRHRGDRRRHREAQLSQVRAFFFGDCSFFFIDCFDRIVSQFLQLCQEYTSPAFDSLSCLVKNLVRAGGHGGCLRGGRLFLCQSGFCPCAPCFKGFLWG